MARRRHHRHRARDDAFVIVNPPALILAIGRDEITGDAALIAAAAIIVSARNLPDDDPMVAQLGTLTADQVIDAAHNLAAIPEIAAALDKLAANNDR